MTRGISPKATAYAALGGLGLLAALVLRRPELAALAAPFLLLLAAALLTAGDPGLQAWVRVDRDRALAGETAELEVELAVEHPVARVEVLLELPQGVTVDGDNPVAVHVPGEDGTTLRFPLRIDRWGTHRLGGLTLRTRDSFGVFSRTDRVDADVMLKAYPRPEALRRLLRGETQLYSGDELSRLKGEGMEFADLRPFVYGDRVKRINWRASARRGELWVNEQHPERNMDVVLFLDSFADVRRGADSSLDLAVRAASTLAARYIRRRDRVGLVSFGGYVRWLTPGSGLAHAYRIVDALLDTEVTLSYAWKAIDVVPARTLPPQALVIALTPLLDERSVRALFHLRARGFDIAVVELSPLALVEPGPEETDELAYRLWRLEREALRAQFRSAGIAVVPWQAGTPLAVPLEEVTRFRRSARLVHA